MTRVHLKSLFFNRWWFENIGLSYLLHSMLWTYENWSTGPIIQFIEMHYNCLLLPNVDERNSRRGFLPLMSLSSCLSNWVWSFDLVMRVVSEHSLVAAAYCVDSRSDIIFSPAMETRTLCNSDAFNVSIKSISPTPYMISHSLRLSFSQSLSL